VFNHYLKEYPPLPFEILVVFCQKENDNLTFHDVIKVPPLMTSIVRQFHMPYFLMEILKSKFNISYLPEFILKNAGVRRARGEFILAFNSDAVLHKEIFDYILHQQFSLLTYYRAPRIEVSCSNSRGVILYIDQTPAKSNQDLLNICYDPLFSYHFYRYGNGDLQGCHWQMWQNARGFVENDCVFFIDIMFCIEATAQPSELFVKTITNVFHIIHDKITHNTHHFPSSDDMYTHLAWTGQYTYLKYWPREQWGLADYSMLPAIIF
jgi:hypothetical protein